MTTKAEKPEWVIRMTEKKPTLKEAQEIVGGYVEIVYLNDGSQMLVNEEGWVMSLPLNAEASVLAQQPIAGRALILSGKARWK